MKTIFKLSIWIAIPLMIATGICNAQVAGKQANSKIKVKSGNLVLKTSIGGKEENDIFIFDNYGERFYFETGNECYIADLSKTNAYMLDHNKKIYTENTMNKIYASSLCANLLEWGTITNSPLREKLPDRIIAGKNCTTYSCKVSPTETLTIAVWEGLPFLVEGSRSKIIATSFSETIPEGIFNVPADYKLVEAK